MLKKYEKVTVKYNPHCLSKREHSVAEVDIVSFDAMSFVLRNMCMLLRCRRGVEVDGRSTDVSYSYGKGGVEGVSKDIVCFGSSQLMALGGAVNVVTACSDVIDDGAKKKGAVVGGMSSARSHIDCYNNSISVKR